MTATAVDEAVTAALQADAPLRVVAPGGVYPDLAPEGVPMPYLVVLLENHEDIQQHGRVAYEDAVYLVMAIDKANDAAQVNAAYSRAHAVLTASPLVVADATTMDLVRVGRQRFAERDGSVIWRYVGGRYRVMVDPT